MKEFVITKEFLIENDACKEKIEWFLQQKKDSMTIKELKEADCHVDYLAWIASHLYYAGKKKYTKEILKALIEMGDPCSLYYAGKDWSDEKYTKGIAKALIETGNTYFIYYAGQDWEDSRYIVDMGIALIEFADPYSLYLAGQKWKDSRYVADMGIALIKTNDKYYIYCAMKNWKDSRKLDLNKQENWR